MPSTPRHRTPTADQHPEVPPPASYAVPVAVIGMGCRFPGARDPEEFWQLMREGRDAITEVPSDRWNVAALYDPDAAAPGMMNTRWGGFLEHAAEFDARFFGISPREAEHMDPQQRLLLEVAWEALEHAGQAADRLAGSRTGVFVGIASTDYMLAHYADHLDAITAYTGTGNAHSIAANRLSYVLDLHGPSLAIDTACSSSLVAVDVACQSLASGATDLALAGGVNMILSPELSVAFSKARMMATDGRCKAFDAEADGYVRAEGCGIVILKRVSDAVRDGDNILAIIRGSAVNQDGRTMGITAPNALAQAAVIRLALQRAGMSPREVSYVETHGTGTALGDPIEFQALCAALGGPSARGDPCLLGSIKANVGHLEVASGVAGLIKAVLCLQHDEVPAQLHLRRLNPHISLNGTRFDIPTEVRPWPRGARRRIAGVNSFGFGGTNAHVVVEEAPLPPPRAQAAADRPEHVLALSARTESALREIVRRLEAHLRRTPSLSMADVCHTASVGRSHFSRRLAVAAASTSQLAARLRAWEEGRTPPGLLTGHAPADTRLKIAFLFTGQGSQYVGMGRQLYDTQPTFRRALHECAERLRPHLKRPLLDVLYPERRQTSPLDQTAYTQPALFALEYALAELLASWGITPDAVLGHSVGEYVAACVAGVMSPEDALALVAARGRLMQKLPDVGEMAIVFAREAEVHAALVPHSAELAIAAVNGPRNVVISGLRPTLHAVLGELAAKGIRTRPLTVSHAFHSPLMEPILDDFERMASRLGYHASRLPLISNLTGRVMEPGWIPDGGYWRRHARDPVRFADGITGLAEQGYGLFVELGPDKTLLQMGQRCIRKDGAIWLPTLEKAGRDWATLLATIAELYVRGVPISWAGFDRDYAPRKANLPTYPFERVRHWPAAADPRRGENGRSGGLHPLLGERVRSALPTAQFESRISTETIPYLRDHKVRGTVVLPATAYIEMALAAARQILGAGAHALTNVAFHRPLPLAEEEGRLVQIVVSPASVGEAPFRIVSLPHGTEAIEGAWIQHVSGTIRLAASNGAAAKEPPVSVGAIQERCGERLAADELYRALEARGLEYGPTFRLVRELWRRPGEALGRLSPTASLGADVGRYTAHPAVLDACLHVLAAAADGHARSDEVEHTYVPVGAVSVRVLASVDGQSWSHAVLYSRAVTCSELLEGDVRLLSERGEILAEVIGLRLKRLARASRRRTAPNRQSWLYELRWRRQDRDQASRPAVRGCGSWLIFADSSGVGEALAAVLEERGERCVVVQPGERYARRASHRYAIRSGNETDLRRLLGDAIASGDPPCRGIVHLWSLDVPAVDTPTSRLPAASERICGDLVLLVQALVRLDNTAPRLWLVTRGAQAVRPSERPVSVAQAPVWGLGRVIALEEKQLRCTLIDLGPGCEAREADTLAAEILSHDHENQLAFRRSRRYVARLGQVTEPRPGLRDVETQVDAPMAGPFELSLSRSAGLSSLTLRPATRLDIRPGEVEIEVSEAALNFRDVMNAMGRYPEGPLPLGTECAGRIARIGEQVDGLEVGDEVVAVAPGSFATFAMTSRQLVVPKPERLSLEEASTIPIAFLTAYYALHYLAHMSKGERILIHAAAGGVGLAAVQLAQRVGADIFATAGSDEKRGYLASIGVRHVLDSRSLGFADEVMTRTEGAGVDIVLNSLAGAFIQKSLSVLGAHGRFLELGKADIYLNQQIGLYPFRNNLSYHAIALDQVCRDRPQLIQAFLQELMGLFETQQLRPLPHRVFPIAEAVSAFRYMVQRRNTGRVVLSLRSASSAHRAGGAGTLRPDATYLVTGGLGALGLQVAQRMVELGARHLVLVGRRPPSPDARAVLAVLERAGALLLVVEADVADAGALSSVLASIRESMPPLRGVIHAAGVLGDACLRELDARRLNEVMAPKVRGSWNLHQLTADTTLDFFILFSSAASLLGSPGQANYAAANAFLDALAHHRRSIGLPCSSINWGPWDEIGMATRRGRSRHLAIRGLALLPRERAVALFDRLLTADVTQLAVIAADWPRLAQLFASREELPIVSELVVSAGPDGNGGTPQHASDDLRALLLTTKIEERQPLLEGRLRGELARLLGVNPSDVDPRKSLGDLGLDSLMTVELKDELETRLGIVLPLERFTDDPKLVDLAAGVLRELASSGAEDATPSGRTIQPGF